ncbi:unnamed protein product [Rotaria socialis]|uniref:Uncharacterized protein n=1 Tax=Rotaria socialis TaxID=392032 RepID=A0A821JZ87_9BILA|nr:unnamed protein product [Rotaria socialis]
MSRIVPTTKMAQKLALSSKQAVPSLSNYKAKSTDIFAKMEDIKEIPSKKRLKSSSTEEQRSKSAQIEPKPSVIRKFPVTVTLEQHQRVSSMDHRLSASRLE